MPSCKRLTHISVVTSLVVGGIGIFAVACSDDPATSPTVPDASTTADGQPPPAPPDSAIAPDGGSDIITEGGGLPTDDPDAGADDDAGVDAGLACGFIATGAYSATTCSNRSSTATGGALTTTVYTLASVTVLGSATFCANTFTAYEHRGGLKVTASSASTATVEVADLYRKPSAPPLKPTSYRYDAKVVANGTLLTFTPAACASKPAPASAPYSVGTTDSGKKTLVLRLPYGTGSALYRFVEP